MCLSFGASLSVSEYKQFRRLSDAVEDPELLACEQVDLVVLARGLRQDATSPEVKLGPVVGRSRYSEANLLKTLSGDVTFVALIRCTVLGPMG